MIRTAGSVRSCCGLGVVAAPLLLLGCMAENVEPKVSSEELPVEGGYQPPGDGGWSVPPPTLARSGAGGDADGSDNDVGYCHAGYCIDAVTDWYGNGRKIRFNVNLIEHRNDPNLHQVVARAFHPYYVTRDEDNSSNDCIGGWRLCETAAVYDMAVRKWVSCTDMPFMPFDCQTNVWTFQILHSYLWGNQVSTTADHCGDSEGNVVVIRVDPGDPSVAYVWYVWPRYDIFVDARDLDFTGAHPQVTNHKNNCGPFGCGGSHHRPYARRTNDGDAHGWTVDNTVVFFHPGLEYDYKRYVDPTLTCVMPYHGLRCGPDQVDEGHDNDDARCNRPGYEATLTRTTSISGGAGPWGAEKVTGEGTFCGGYHDSCPIAETNPFVEECGWGIGLNVSWDFGDPDAKHHHPWGVISDTGGGSCAGGACGLPNGDCFCDEACLVHGDCCPDACEECGLCADCTCEGCMVDGECTEGVENCANCVDDCGCEENFQCFEGACVGSCDCEGCMLDGTCAEGVEDCGNCPGDCGCGAGFACQEAMCVVDCGDDVCLEGIEDCGTCLEDCPCWQAGTRCENNQCVPYCGNDICGDTPGEDCGTCLEDCPCWEAGTRCENRQCVPYCGNGICGDTAGEDCGTCLEDCPCWQTGTRCENRQCVLYCGNGLCDNGESCGSCSQDCGECQTCWETCQRWVEDVCWRWAEDTCQHWVEDTCQHWVEDLCWTWVEDCHEEQICNWYYIGHREWAPDCYTTTVCENGHWEPYGCNGRWEDYGCNGRWEDYGCNGRWEPYGCNGRWEDYACNPYLC